MQSPSVKILIITIVILCSALVQPLLAGDHLARAEEVAKAGDLDKASEILKEGLEEDETDINLHRKLGQVYVAQKKYVLATEELDYFIRHNGEKSAIEAEVKIMEEIGKAKFAEWEKHREDDERDKKIMNTLFMALKCAPELADNNKGDVYAGIHYWNAKMNEGEPSAGVIYKLAYLHEVKGNIIEASDLYAQLLDYVEDATRITCIIDRYDFLNRNAQEKIMDAIAKFRDKRERLIADVNASEELTPDEKIQAMDFIEMQSEIADKIDAAGSDEERMLVIKESGEKFKKAAGGKKEMPAGIKKILEKEAAAEGKSYEQYMKEYGLN